MSDAPAALRNRISGRFAPYLDFNPSIPVWCLTPTGLDGCIHRFYDTSPVSPSGRYVALTRLPTEKRPPYPGETADVVMIDLESGEWRVVASTNAFDCQLGAQVQWGRNDRELYFNVLDPRVWRPHAIRLDPLSGSRVRLDGPVYMVSPDGTKLASPCLVRTSLTQAGYGAVVPATALPLNARADSRDGLYITDAGTGKCSLLVSFAQIRDSLEVMAGDLQRIPGALYGFHVKWNPQGTRLMFVVRLRRSEGTASASGRLNYVVTMNADGSGMKLALPASIWSRGGHHPNWCPDGVHIVQNLNLDGSGMRFVRYRYDGSGLCALAPNVIGGGHPTMHVDGRHILTDAYLNEAAAFGDGTTPLRWLDLKTGTEEVLVRLPTQPVVPGIGKVLRVDPHPAWDRSFQNVVFNACPDGKRRVFMADFSTLLLT